MSTVTGLRELLQRRHAWRGLLVLMSFSGLVLVACVFFLLFVFPLALGGASEFGGQFSSRYPGRHGGGFLFLVMALLFLFVFLAGALVGFLTILEKVEPWLDSILVGWAPKSTPEREYIDTLLAKLTIGAILLSLPVAWIIAILQR